MRRPAGIALVAAVAGIAAWSIAFHPWAWLYGLGVHPYPASSGTPWTYQLWSGFMPALTVLTLFGSVLSLWRLHNCHHEGCWRLGKHKIDGTPWCSRHQERIRLTETVDLAAVAGRLDRIIALLQATEDRAMGRRR